MELSHNKNKIALGLGTAVVALVIGVAALLLIAQGKLPGESLYAVQTDAAEEVVAVTKFSATAKVTFAVDRLKRRLNELKRVGADQATTSPEALQAVANLSNEHVQTALFAITNTVSLSQEERIIALANLTNVAKAEETLTEADPEFETIANSLEDTRGTADDQLRTEIDAFASSSDPVAVQGLIAKELKEVSEQLALLAPGSRAQGIVFRRMSDTDESITDGAYADALRYIFKAKEAIAVDAYLYDAERGFIEGITPEAQPAPEGN